MPGEVFPGGIAAGEPSPHGVVLWTCLDERAAAASISGGQATVRYEVAADERFTQPLLTGEVTTHAGLDWTVKVDVTDPALHPYTHYWYRFRLGGTGGAGGALSRTGRFKTLPDENSRVERLKVAYVCCQDYTNGYYTALTHLAEEDLDFVIFLGDYVYETTDESSFQSGQIRPLTLPGGRTRAESLADYRFLYRFYKKDPELQRLHERFAMFHGWDDHEFANDSYGMYDKDSDDEARNYSPARRLAASQAWWEYIPTRLEFHPERGPVNAIQVYRTVRVGDLIELVMTDERLYRDGPPCGLGTMDMYFTTGCPERLSEERTILGAPQRDWFLRTMKESGAVWKLWANQTLAMQLKLSSAALFRNFPWLPRIDVFFNLDQWDGFPAERERVLSALAGVENLVAITGDIHSFGAGYLRPDFDDPTSPAIGTCVIGGSITSSNLVELITFGRGGLFVPAEAELTEVLVGSNPHLKYFSSACHGYVVLDITREAITASLKGVSTVREPQADLLLLREYRIPRGDVQLVRVDDGSCAMGVDDPDLSPVPCTEPEARETRES